MSFTYLIICCKASQNLNAFSSALYEFKSTKNNNEGFHVLVIWILFISMDVPQQKFKQSCK